MVRKILEKSPIFDIIKLDSDEYMEIHEINEIIVKALKKYNEKGQFKIGIVGEVKSGKSTLVENICRETNNRHWVTDRGPLSWMVYDEFFKRNVVNKASFLNFIKSNPDDILIVYCYASDKVLIERYAEHKHEIIDIKAHKQLFEKYVNELAMTNHVLSVDTSKTSIKAVTNKVLNFIRQHEN
jgi:molybdopterin-guanine dinucleotide biosynthesis protein